MKQLNNKHVDRLSFFYAEDLPRLGIKDERRMLFVSPDRATCSLRIAKQQGVNVFNKTNLSSIAEENIRRCRSRSLVTSHLVLSFDSLRGKENEIL